MKYFLVVGVCSISLSCGVDPQTVKFGPLSIPKDYVISNTPYDSVDGLFDIRDDQILLTLSEEHIKERITKSKTEVQLS